MILAVSGGSDEKIANQGSNLVECHAAVGFGSDVDERGGACGLGKEILIPGEVPAFECGLGDAEEGACIHGGLTGAGDGEGKVCVWVGIAGGFAAVDGSMHFEANVKVLTGEEIDLVRGKDATFSSQCYYFMYL